MPAMRVRLRRAKGDPSPVQSRRARRTELLEVGGHTLRVDVQGDGPPLLLITGLGADLDMWAPVTPHLGGFELITFDPPGLGGSSPARLELGMSELADLTARLLDTLGQDRLDVLGYSWGGALAQELAHRHPGRVGRLVLCGTTCGLGGMLGNPHALAALAGPGGQRRGPGLAGLTAQLCAIARWSSLPWLHELSQPTLVVAGGDDPVVPLGNARLLAARLPDSRLHVVPGAGHFFLLEQPEEVAPRVRSFLLDGVADDDDDDDPPPVGGRRRRHVPWVLQSPARRRAAAATAHDDTRPSARAATARRPKAVAGASE
jgi:pimeloyl-ACP methyl ester carboxylesterase